jgi:cellulose synthase/poly-beta-1,6-N-acetylglucosamine synthase-like glycosyltransferase
MDLVSVVIATLGGDSLRTTIQQLNNGTVVPTEILVCVPKENADKVANLGFDNVHIIKTRVRGQVAQRAIGFRRASFSFVLQVDDDIQVQRDMIETLSDNLNILGPGNAVAPIYIDVDTQQYIPRHPTGIIGFVRNVSATLVCGAKWGKKRMGTISHAGANYGVDGGLMAVERKEVQWVPGGCILHYRSGLIVENFYPFSGKAFCEDLIHSYLLRKNGVHLWVVRDAICKIEEPPSLLKGENLFTSDAAARRYFNHLSGVNEWWFLIWLSYTIIRRKLF